MANEEIEISELEFTEKLAGDNLLPVESSTNTKATSLQILKNWLSSFFVGKTGSENISGQKVFKDMPVLNASNNAKAFLKSQTIDITTNPTANQTNQIYFGDKNEFVYGVLQANQDTDKNVSLLMTARNATSSYGSLGVIINPDNSITTGCPASDVAGSIVTTLAKSKTSSGYYKLGNGLIIQWGAVGSSKVEAKGTVTYPTPFTSMSRVATSITESVIAEPRAIRVYEVSLTNFKYSCYKQHSSGATNTATAFMWLAVGY